MRFLNYPILNSVLVGVFLYTFITPLVAGPYLAFKDYGEKASALKFSRIYISDDRSKLRIDFDIDDFKRTTLYQLGSDTITIVNHSNHTFIDVTSANARLINQEMKIEMDKLINQVKGDRASADISLAEAQLKAIKRSQIDRHSLTYKPVGYGARVHKWLANHYQVTLDDKVIEEVYVLPWSDILLDPAVFEIMKSLPEEFRLLVAQQSLGDIYGISFPMDILDGLPVKVVKHGPTGPIRTTQLIVMKARAYDEPFFAIPTAYNRQK